MASAEEYAAWIVQNADKRGTPEFDTVAQAYQMAKGQKQSSGVSTQIANDPISQGAKNFAQDLPWYQKLTAGMGKAPADIAAGIGQALGMTDTADVAETRKLDAPLMNTGVGLAGNVAGNVASLLPTAMIPGANTMVGAGLIGGGLGASQPVTEGESRLTNTAIGAGGGLAGQGLANVLGRLIRPVQSSLDPTLQGLAGKAEGYGIPLTAAQRTGSKPLKVMDSVMENLPLTADTQAGIKATQAKAFNRAVLSAVGETADTASPDVLNAARTRIGGQFNALAGRNTVTLGDDFLDALATVESGTNAFTKPGVRQSVDKALELAAAGKISGKTYQNVRSTLGKQANDAFSSGNSEVGQALKSIKSALDDAATSSISAADKSAWQTARAQWQALKVLEKAAAPTSADAVAGNVSAAKLAQALSQVDKKGFTYGTRGDDLSDLARIGQGFLKDQIPNSGTAQRSFYQDFLTNPINAAWQGGIGGISLPVQKLMNSGLGQKYLGQGPIDPKMLALARALREGSGMGGAGLFLANGQQQ